MLDAHVWWVLRQESLAWRLQTAGCWHLHEFMVKIFDQRQNVVVG